MLCTIFLGEETNVRKTVTALVSKTLQKCNCHWRTRIYERKQQSVGILVTHCLLSKILCRYEFPFSANYAGLPHRGRAVAGLSVNVQQSGRSIERPLHWIIG